MTQFDTAGPLPDTVTVTRLPTCYQLDGSVWLYSDPPLPEGQDGGRPRPIPGGYYWVIAGGGHPAPPVHLVGGAGMAWTQDSGVFTTPAAPLHPPPRDTWTPHGTEPGFTAVRHRTPPYHKGRHLIGTRSFQLALSLACATLMTAKLPARGPRSTA